MRAVKAVAMLTVGCVLSGPVAAAQAEAGEPVRVSGDTPFPDGCPGGRFGVALYPGAEQQPLLAANPSNPDNLVAVWLQDPASPYGSLGLVAGVSTDRGSTWTTVPIPGITKCAGDTPHTHVLDAAVSFGVDGVVYVTAWALNYGSGIASNVESALVTTSRDGGFTWTVPTVLSQQHGYIANNSGPVTADPAVPGRAFLVTQNGFFLPVPVDWQTTTIFRTENGGKSWSLPVPIHVAISSFALASDIAVVGNTVVWIFTEVRFGLAPDRIMAVRSTDGGATWSLPVEIAQLTAGSVTDPDNGQLVRSRERRPVVATTPDGTIHVAWQEVDSTTSSRVMLAMSPDAGLTWTQPAAIMSMPWQAFTPALAAGADGALRLSFYDFRNDAPGDAALTTDVWHARAPGWEQVHVGGPFDMRLAPVVLNDVLDVGLSMGLTAGGVAFVQTVGDRTTDVFYTPVT